MACKEDGSKRAREYWMKKKILAALLFFLLTLAFYRFQVKPSNEKQRALEKQVESLQKQVKSQGRNSSDSSDEVSELKDQVQNLEDSLIQSQQEAEDETNNKANC